jgi:hypothetical protein
MYLFGLNPLLTPIVAAGRPGIVDAAMDGARTVETGYNYVPTKDVSLKVPPTAQVNPLPQPVEQPKAVAPDVDALTEQLQQLSLNLAMMAKSTNNKPRVSFQDRSNRPPITCFKCGKEGHIARECRSRNNSNN